MQNKMKFVCIFHTRFMFLFVLRRTGSACKFNVYTRLLFYITIYDIRVFGNWSNCLYDKQMVSADQVLARSVFNSSDLGRFFRRYILA
jgi:hypothetical protein